MSLVRLVNHKTGISQRKLADKFNCTHRTIGNTLKKNGIQIRKCKKASKSIPLQQERQRFWLRKMDRRDFAPKNGKKIIMDDESYFTLDGVSMPGNKSYYTSDPAATPDNVKFAQVKKFPERVMIWFCISEDGPSIMHVFDKHQTMTANLYREKCFPKLVKFLKNTSITRMKSFSGRILLQLTMLKSVWNSWMKMILIMWLRTTIHLTVLRCGLLKTISQY